MEPNIPQPFMPPAEAIWPPPPTNQASLPQAHTYPFKTQFSYAQGSVPNFRVGVIALHPQGVTIQGKAVTRYEIQVPILIVCLFLRFAFIIAYAILEYAVRRDETISVGWENVRDVVLVPKKRRVCLVYDAPNYKGAVKTFSLAFKLDMAQYAALVTDVRQSLPDRVREGKLRAWTSPASWVFLGGIVLGIAFLAAIYATPGRGALGH